MLVKGVDEAQRGEEHRREHVRKRLSRKRLGSDVHPLIPILVPNLLLYFCFGTHFLLEIPKKFVPRLSHGSLKM
jgi:hypothetical protein